MGHRETGSEDDPTGPLQEGKIQDRIWHVKRFVAACGPFPRRSSPRAAGKRRWERDARIG